MYKKVLVPLALDHGLSGSLLEIARRLLLPGGEILALHVVEAAFGLARATQSEAHAQDAFDRARNLMEDKLLDEDNVVGHVIEGHVYRSIIEFSEEHEIRCIVMGSHKPDLSDFLLGSTAASVVRHAHCAVHVHR